MQYSTSSFEIWNVLNNFRLVTITNEKKNDWQGHPLVITAFEKDLVSF